MKIKHKITFVMPIIAVIIYAPIFYIILSAAPEGGYEHASQAGKQYAFLAGVLFTIPIGLIIWKPIQLLFNFVIPMHNNLFTTLFFCFPVFLQYTVIGFIFDKIRFRLHRKEMKKDEELSGRLF